MWSSEGNYSSSLREVLTKRCNILKGMPGEIEVGQGLRTRGDLDATKHLILHRISVRREVHQQQDISMYYGTHHHGRRQKVVEHMTKGNT